MIAKNKKVVLDNGLRLLFIPHVGSNVSSIGFAVNAGSYFEDAPVAGISHVVEHLISRSGKGPSLRQEIHQIGAILDAATSISQTYYHLFSFDEDLVDVTKTLIQSVYFPNFREEDLRFSLESVLSEMAYTREVQEYEMLRGLMWKDHKLVKPIVGTKDSIFSLTLSDVTKYHQKLYTAKNSSVIVIGQEFPEDLEVLLKTIPNTREVKPVEMDASVKKPSYKVFQDGNLRSALTLGFPTRGYRGLGEDRHIFNLAATILKSQFNQQLGKYGLIYDVDWTWNVFPDTGDFIIVLEDLSDDRLLAVTEKCLSLLSNWREVSVSQSEFDSIKKHRILRIKIGESLIEALPLFTKNFSSSEDAHTYDETIGVYTAATIDDTYATLAKVLLSDKPYVVVNLGVNSVPLLGKVNQLLEDYYR